MGCIFLFSDIIQESEKINYLMHTIIVVIIVIK